MILASTSPRRKELLEKAGFSFTTLDPSYDEQVRPSLSAHDLVAHLAYKKCEAAWNIISASPSDASHGIRSEQNTSCLSSSDSDGQVTAETLCPYSDSRERPELIVSSDTVVALDETILEKPLNRYDAYHMLTKLSGKTHTVYTGVCLGFLGSYQGFVSATQVTFRTLTPEFISWYLSCNEYVDKAGAYAIQGIGRLCVASFEGDYDTVVGFPTSQFYETVQQLAVSCAATQEQDSTALPPLVASLNHHQIRLLHQELTRIHPSIGTCHE